ncbi:MAG: DUF58 domain-containing protein [Planctomycetota bacterium]
MTASSSRANSSAIRPPLLDEDFLARIERLSLVSRRTVSGRVRGERRSRRRGFSNEFADYRDYVAGDDLRYLDWNIYGRLERLFVKLFHEEEDLTLSILIDASDSMAHGEPEKLTYALRVAAALAAIAITSGDRVGLFPFHTELLPPLAPQRGRHNLPRILRYLQDVPAGGETRLEPSLRTFSSAFRRRGMVVLISDLLDPVGFDAALRHIGGRGVEPFVIHVLSPDEIAPALTGDLRLVDCENGSAVEISVTRGLLSAYQRTVDGFREAVRQSASRRGIVPLFTSTAVPFDQLVLSYLRTRGVLK